MWPDWSQWGLVQEVTGGESPVTGAAEGFGGTMTARDGVKGS